MCSVFLSFVLRRRSRIQSVRSLTELQPTQSLIKCNVILRSELSGAQTTPPQLLSPPDSLLAGRGRQRRAAATGCAGRRLVGGAHRLARGGGRRVRRGDTARSRLSCALGRRSGTRLGP